MAARIAKSLLIPEDNKEIGTLSLSPDTTTYKEGSFAVTTPLNLL
jgi:hypothetical protein